MAYTLFFTAFAVPFVTLMDVDGAVRELYFEWNGELVYPGLSLVGDLTVRAGQQIFSWGSGVLYNPTDNLSPWNAVDPFDAHRLGMPGAHNDIAAGGQRVRIDHHEGHRPR